MTSFGNKILFFLILFISIFFLNSAKSIENKIIVKVDNEIITSFDVIKEIDYLSLLNKNINSSVKSELLFSDKLNNSIDLNKFTTVLTACELFGSIFSDFFPSGPSIFIMLSFNTTLTFSGIDIFNFPIFDIKIPYKLPLHQPFAF